MTTPALPLLLLLQPAPAPALLLPLLLQPAPAPALLLPLLQQPAPAPAPAACQPELTDFPGCGTGNQRRRAVDKCFWDCSWVENPYYGKEWRVSVVDQNLNTTFADVRYFMTTPKIPTDLDCLDDCRLKIEVG
jgi:hypothetical protein